MVIGKKIYDDQGTVYTSLVVYTLATLLCCRIRTFFLNKNTIKILVYVPHTPTDMIVIIVIIIHFQTKMSNLFLHS